MRFRRHVALIRAINRLIAYMANCFVRLCFSRDINQGQVGFLSLPFDQSHEINVSSDPRFLSLFNPLSHKWPAQLTVRPQEYTNI